MFLFPGRENVGQYENRLLPFLSKAEINDVCFEGLGGRCGCGGEGRGWIWVWGAPGGELGNPNLHLRNTIYT